MFEVSDSIIGEKYARLIKDNSNDAFHEMIIDAITDNKTVRKKRIQYRTNSELKTLYMASSALKDESEKNRCHLVF